MDKRYILLRFLRWQIIHAYVEEGLGLSPTEDIYIGAKLELGR